MSTHYFDDPYFPPGPIRPPPERRPWLKQEQEVLQQILKRNDREYYIGQSRLTYDELLHKLNYSCRYRDYTQFTLNDVLMEIRRNRRFYRRRSEPVGNESLGSKIGSPSYNPYPVDTNLPKRAWQPFEKDAIHDLLRGPDPDYARATEKMNQTAASRGWPTHATNEHPGTTKT